MRNPGREIGSITGKYRGPLHEGFLVRGIVRGTRNRPICTVFDEHAGELYVKMTGEDEGRLYGID